ncbi:hypothetical protein [Halioxenophilus aromaticivorans]|uniref:Uncharacterized protein n=1 Tax=Halioxenophilus aromaticivorans TaxID=1306992 RepID=A0AAV3U5Q0_9ALTE
MSDHQKKAFWAILTGFFIAATVMLYKQQVFNSLQLGGILILGACYLVCGVFIYRFVKTNPGEIESWFK